MYEPYLKTMFEFQEKGHKYLLDGERMTGVTTILSVLAKPQLIPWASRMACEWIRENCEAQAYGHANGKFEDAYLVPESDLQEAEKAHAKKRDDAADKGTDIHAQIENWVKEAIDTPHGYPLVSEDASEALKKFANWAAVNKVRFLSSEKPVYSREWFCAGTPDFTFEKDGKRFVGDLKTYKKIWDRVPHFQMAAYMKMLVEMGEPEYHGTCIVNVNKETNELTEQWSYAWQEDLKGFESALTLYRLLNNY